MGELASTGQLRMAFARRALFTVPLIVVLGFVAGAVSNNGDNNLWYALLKKPSFQPPSWAFPVAWTTLYVLLGLALAKVLNARGSERRSSAVLLFAIQFALNLAWSPVFFALHRPTWAFVVLALMIAFAIATTRAFWRIRTSAGLLMLPYLAWLCFAGALNWQIVRLNPDADTLVVPQSGTQIEIKR